MNRPTGASVRRSLRVRDHLRRNAIAYAALFVALGGTAWAQATIGSEEVIDDSLRSVDVKDDQLRSVDVRANDLTGADVSESTLGKVPDASKLDGVDSSGYLSYDSEIPSGVTVTGFFGSQDHDSDDGLTTDPFARGYVSLPARAPKKLSSDTVNFADGDAIGSDDDPACDGDVDQPTAPPGKVCLYTAFTQGTAATASGTVSCAICGGGPSGERYGFVILGPSAGASGLEEAFVEGTWAYTAP